MNTFSTEQACEADINLPHRVTHRAEKRKFYDFLSPDDWLLADEDVDSDEEVVVAAEGAAAGVDDVLSPPVSLFSVGLSDEPAADESPEDDSVEAVELVFAPAFSARKSVT